MASSTSATNAAASTPLSSNLGLYNSTTYASAYAQRYAQLGRYLFLEFIFLISISQV